MYPRDVPLSGARKSCRRWFPGVFRPPRSIGTPGRVSKRRSENGVRWALESWGREVGGVVGRRGGGVARGWIGWEVVDATLCCIDMNLYPSGAGRSPFSLLFLSLACCFRHGLFPPFLSPFFLLSGLHSPGHHSFSFGGGPAHTRDSSPCKNTSRPCRTSGGATFRMSRDLSPRQSVVGLTTSPLLFG